MRRSWSGTRGSSREGELSEPKILGVELTKLVSMLVSEGGADDAKTLESVLEEMDGFDKGGTT